MALQFSYRAILAAIVSQNSFVLVFVGYRTIIARYVAKWGIAQMCLCETKYQGGGIAPFWGSANLPEKVSRDMGYRSDSIAISRDMGPLRGSVGLGEGVSGPGAKKSQESLEKVSRPSAPPRGLKGPTKVSKKVRKVSKNR